MKKYTRGFTLIELLVVIAIIGILSSIILVSLNTARSKANDSKIQGQISSIRSAAEIYYSNNGNSYANMQSVAASGSGSYSTGDLSSGLYNLTKVASSWPTGLPTVGANATGWVAYRALVASTTASACADSSGASVIVTTSLLASTKLCDGTTTF